MATTDRTCPRCGGTQWNPLVDWRRPVSFGVSYVACRTCSLTASEVGLDGAIVPHNLQERNAHVTFTLADISLEWLDPNDVHGGAKVTHIPTGIAVEARAFRAPADNRRGALQALALRFACDELTADEEVR